MALPFQGSLLMYRLLLPLSLLLTLSLSFDLVRSHATKVLDVAGSIQTTLEALSLHHQGPQLEQETELEKTTETSFSAPYFSVPIHPRMSLPSPTHHHHQDYKSLTESRLARDSARVDLLLAKLEFSLRGTSRAELRPADSQFATQADVAAPVTSGSTQGSGEYFVRVGVGRPATPYYLVLDTGSDVSWLQCQPCSDCYQQSDPIYKPASSSTYSPVACGSPLCTRLDLSSCARSQCLYQVSYGDGSYTTGDLMTETVSFGSSRAVDKVAMGCGHDNVGLFVASAGLLGLGGGTLSLISQIKATSFSYCLVDRDSGKSSTLEFNSARPSGAVSTRLLRNAGVDTFYHVSVTGMSVGGKPVSIPTSLVTVGDSGSSGVVVDSGRR